ncbi:MAG: HTTM domain-containing protein [Deltaproteobacteria bacterium]|nr:HTTM domain-containing protein [Deltaproteobacteria bacterium]
MAKKRTRRPAKPAPATPAPATPAVAANKPAADKPAATKPAADKRDPKSATNKTGPYKLPAPEQPAFWFGFEVAWAKLAIGRVVLFGMLALDALLQIRHAPRYGAGGFNVAQIPLLDALGPTRASYAVAELLNAWLFTLAAFGVATRWVLPAAAAIYGWLYFGSQLDSYQHHYLVSMLLLLACFVPWQRPPDGAPRVRTWALRLMLVELGIMYLWAAISKMNGAWTNGTTLATQIIGPMRHMIDATVGIAFASKLVILVELSLAALVWQPRFAAIIAPLGLAFHVGILFSGLEIGLFAWLMIAIYLFVIPDRVYDALVRVLATPLGAWRVIAAWFDGALGWFVWLVGIVLALVFAMLTRFEYAGRIGVLLLVVTIAGTVVSIVRAPTARRMTAIGLAHLAAFTLWLATDRSSTVAVDYYRFWGGTSRRLGDLAASERAYRELIAVAPYEPTGHMQLGRLLLNQGKSDEGLAELHEAEHVAPSDPRAYVVEARWLATHGNLDDALIKAKDATYADPNDKSARDLLDKLSRGGAPPAETP